MLGKIDKPLIAVLGLGEMGMVHAHNLAKVRAIRLGLASTRADVLQTTAAELSADAVYEGYEAALQDANVTAVVIATAPTTHPDLITRAAGYGKHIFSEKPLGDDSVSIRTALSAVRHANVRFVTGFMRRWDEAYVSAQRRVASHSFGDVVTLKCTTGDADYPEKYRREAAPYALLKDLAVHDVDLARWFTMSDVVRVFAVMDALAYPTLREKRDGDVGLAVLEMASGAKVSVHVSRALRYGYNVTTDVVCQDGSFHIGDLGRVDLDQASKGRCAREIDVDFRARFANAFENEMTAFAKVVLASDQQANALLAKDSRYASADDGLKATIVSEALVKSAQTGMPVDIVYE